MLVGLVCALAANASMSISVTARPELALVFRLTLSVQETALPPKSTS
jgi:hypothetical protein